MIYFSKNQNFDRKVEVAFSNNNNIKDFVIDRINFDKFEYQVRNKTNQMTFKGVNNNMLEHYRAYSQEFVQFCIENNVPLTVKDTKEIINLRKIILNKQVCPINCLNYIYKKRNIINEYEKLINLTPKEGNLAIVFGYPGAGKTTCIKKYQEILGIKVSDYLNLDADDIKMKLPGYDNGQGFPVVHESSIEIFRIILDKIKNIKANVIIQTTGWPEYALDIINDFNKAGYKNIKAVYIDITSYTAQGRVVSRFNNSDKFLDPAIVNTKDNYPRRCFEILKNNPSVNEIIHIDNNGKKSGLIGYWLNQRDVCK